MAASSEHGVKPSASLWEISQLAEELIASEDGLRSVELFRWLFG